MKTQILQFLKQRPLLLISILANLLVGRLRIPRANLEPLLSAAMAQVQSDGLEVEMESPGLRVRTQANVLGTNLRISLRVVIERFYFTQDELRVRLRLEDSDIAPIGTPKAPFAAIFASGVLDFSKLGTLASWVNDLPPVVVDAASDWVEIDLMKVDAVSQHELLPGLLKKTLPYIRPKRLTVHPTAVVIPLQLFPS